MPTTRTRDAHPENQTNVSEGVPGAQAPVRELWFESGGTRLFAVEKGQGRPIVFVHGGLADHRAATFRVGPLAAKHRLITPDLRGSGRSVHAGELSWELLADDLAALLDHLGLERAIVGGTSMGSGVALRFALRHPARLEGLILMSPVYPGADRPLPDAANAAMRVMVEGGERVAVEGVEALRPLFEQLPPPVRDIAMLMMRGFDAASVRSTTKFLASNAQPMASARELVAIDAKALILPGTDPQHPAEIAQLYAQNLQRAVLVDQTVPDHLDKVIEFCATL